MTVTHRHYSVVAITWDSDVSVPKTQVRSLVVPSKRGLVICLVLIMRRPRLDMLCSEAGSYVIGICVTCFILICRTSRALEDTLLWAAGYQA